MIKLRAWRIQSPAASWVSVVRAMPRPARHGNDTLAAVLVVLNLLAFALHTVCELTETHWQQARQRLGA